MSYAWLSLVPPLITLAIALIFKRIGTAIFAGIISGTLIIFKFNPIQAVLLATARIWANSQLGNLFTWSGNFNTLYTFGFLFVIGIIVALINYTGGAQAYANKIKEHLSDKRSVETSSFLLSVGLFLDDYLNCLTVGCALRPLTDRFKIPRAKLAYLIDSMAVPWIIIVPISSWVAVMSNMFQKAGISDTTRIAYVIADPFYAYLNVIPYVFYSSLTIITVIWIIRARISFGPMHRQEEIANSTGNLLGGANEPDTNATECIAKKASILEFALPLACLVFCFLIGLLYSGNSIFFGGPNSIFQAFQHADSFPVMFWSSIISLMIGLSFSWSRGSISFSSLRPICYQGIQLMAYSNLVLLLAWTLSDLLKNYLHTGDYLAYLISGAVPLKLLPCIFYILSAIISTALGSSWATMMIIIPLAVQMVIAYLPINPPFLLHNIPILLPTLGAILSGAATGDHLSPIACTTIMSSTSSGARVMDHVKTQFVYALPVIIASICAFLVAGLTISLSPLMNLVASLGTGLFIIVPSLWLLNRNK